MRRFQGVSLLYSAPHFPLAVASCYQHGAPDRSKKRMMTPARSETKSSKDRFNLREAMIKDRERLEKNKTLPWKERLAQLKVYPWKTFVVFMILWSYLGTIVVPWFKGLKAGEVPSVGPQGQKIPKEMLVNLTPTPQFDHLVKREEARKAYNSATNALK